MNRERPGLLMCDRAGTGGVGISQRNCRHLHQCCWSGSYRDLNILARPSFFFTWFLNSKNTLSIMTYFWKLFRGQINNMNTVLYIPAFEDGIRNQMIRIHNSDICSTVCGMVSQTTATGCQHRTDTVHWTGASENLALHTYRTVPTEFEKS